MDASLKNHFKTTRKQQRRHVVKRLIPSIHATLITFAAACGHAGILDAQAPQEQSDASDVSLNVTEVIDRINELRTTMIAALREVANDDAQRLDERFVVEVGRFHQQVLNLAHKNDLLGRGASCVF